MHEQNGGAKVDHIVIDEKYIDEDRRCSWEAAFMACGFGAEPELFDLVLVPFYDRLTVIFPSTVSFRNTEGSPFDHFSKRSQWLGRNCRRSWTIFMKQQTLTYLFEDAADAALFKLRWVK
jgi:hypothetical protein